MVPLLYAGPWLMYPRLQPEGIFFNNLVYTLRLKPGVQSHYLNIPNLWLYIRPFTSRLTT